MNQTPSGIILPREPFVPGTVKPESDYEEFSRLGAKLGLPCPQTHVSLESRSQDGAVVDLYQDRSRTLNRNYWNWLFKQFGLFNGVAGSLGNINTTSAAMASDATFSAGHLTQKNTAGTILNNTSVANGLSPWTIAASGIATQGIVIGTGVVAESFEDSALGTPIAHGNLAGQMAYNAMALQTPSYNAGTLTWTATTVRIFNNNSGGTIVVGETGIYAGGGPGTYMIMRDKLAATVSVLNAGQLTVTYTFTLVFPA